MARLVEATGLTMFPTLLSSRLDRTVEWPVQGLVTEPAVRCGAGARFPRRPCLL